MVFYMWLSYLTGVLWPDFFFADADKIIQLSDVNTNRRMGRNARVQAERENWEAVGCKIVTLIGDVLLPPSLDASDLPPVEAFSDRLKQVVDFYLVALFVILPAWGFLTLVMVGTDRMRGWRGF